MKIKNMIQTIQDRVIKAHRVDTSILIANVYIDILDTIKREYGSKYEYVEYMTREDLDNILESFMI